VLIGSAHCYQQIEVTFKFNDQHAILDQKISGGEFA
jgi:hypothetical protein